MALARYVRRLNLSGKRAVELGCGVGLPAAVALERGAEVLATDHYPEALDFAAYNARKNTGRQIKTAVLDWQRPDLEGLGTFDLVLAADVLYERRNVSPLVNLVPKLLASNAQMLLADPRRPGAKLFIEAMEGLGFEASSEEATVEQEGREVKVLLHRLRR